MVRLLAGHGRWGLDRRRGAFKSVISRGAGEAFAKQLRRTQVSTVQTRRNPTIDAIKYLKQMMCCGVH
jgi:hypothetical protein